MLIVYYENQSGRRGIPSLSIHQKEPSHFSDGYFHWNVLHLDLHRISWILSIMNVHFGVWLTDMMTVSMMMIVIVMMCIFPNNGWRVRCLPSISIQCRLYFEPNVVWFDWVISSEPDHVYEWPAPSRRAGDAINLNLTAIMDRISPCDDKGHSMMMIYRVHGFSYGPNAADGHMI